MIKEKLDRKAKGRKKKRGKKGTQRLNFLEAAEKKKKKKGVIT